MWDSVGGTLFLESAPSLGTAAGFGCWAWAEQAVLIEELFLGGQQGWSRGGSSVPLLGTISGLLAMPARCIVICASL